MTVPQSAIVVGAGVVGVSTAYALARRGLAVTLVERHEEPGMETSHANGAQLSYLYTDALASPALLSQMPKLALGLVPAFRMRRRLDLDYLRWIAAFLRNCTRERFRANTLATLHLALESRVAMEELAGAHPLDFGYRTAGKMHVYRSQRAFDAARAVAEMKAGPGVVQHALSPSEAFVMEPALERAAPGIRGVLHSPEEAVGDPHRFACAMRDLLVDRYGAATRFARTVTRLRLEDDRALAVCADGEELSADIAVDCSGSEGGRLLRPFGIRLPIMPMKGYSFTAPAAPASPSISITDVEAKIVFTRLGGQVRVAGLADLGNFDRAVDPRRMAALVDGARRSMPRAAAFDRAGAFWTGLRPMTPDAQPRIARPHPRLAYNLGHGVLGWTLAMGSAERLARLVLR
ncbi:FAD-dependent oxidoreductase [Pelagerythrobacter marinus]|uniref:FAD-dependent oxidoreductase n=1 Tax=Pelagerythrobacter marinus TaxID=538382 RepID=UPI002036CF47|nr:FAD-dependent oxidoreductase [Pelagerythrobacter marinus]USA40096.1 FAD-dependent oxidoreductase [Pelagerythrobacter marinus]WPZ05782.1 FAD-dependent oxidoreductase [Pelagerythrobacter marinus]